MGATSYRPESYRGCFDQSCRHTETDGGVETLQAVPYESTAAKHGDRRLGINPCCTQLKIYHWKNKLLTQSPLSSFLFWGI